MHCNDTSYQHGQKAGQNKIIQTFITFLEQNKDNETLTKELELCKSTWLKQPARIGRRLRAITLVAEGYSIAQVTSLLGCHARSVKNWLNSFMAKFTGGLVDKPRSGRPTKLTDEMLDLLNLLLVYTPKSLIEQGLFLEFQHLLKDQERWTPALVATVFDISKATATKYLAQAELKIKINGSYCYSSDPWFIYKLLLVDLAYRYGKELGYNVYCFDEKPCIQILRHFYQVDAAGKAQKSDRYERIATTHLIACIDCHDQQVTYRLGHKKDCAAVTQFFLDFFNDPVRKGQKSVVIMDNLQVHGKVQEELAKELGDHVQFIYTPTNACWSNLIEAIFSKFEVGAIRGFSFASEEQFNEHFKSFIDAHNEQAKAEGKRLCWDADIEKICGYKLSMLLTCQNLPADAALLKDFVNDSLTREIQSVTGLMAEEINAKENLLTAIDKYPWFFSALTNEVVHAALTSESNNSAPATFNAMPKRRCEIMLGKAGVFAFSPEVKQGLTTVQGAYALFQRLISMPEITKPYRKPSSREVSMSTVNESQGRLNTLNKKLEELLQDYDDAVKQSLDATCLYERQSHINRASLLVSKAKARLAKTTEQFQNRLHKAEPVIRSMVNQGLTTLKRLLVVYKDLHPDFKVTVV